MVVIVNLKSQTITCYILQPDWSLLLLVNIQVYTLLYAISKVVYTVNKVAYRKYYCTTSCGI